MRLTIVLFAPLLAVAQTTCPSVNFLEPRTVSLAPTLTTHIDVVRQPDGSNTGFEVANAAPYRVISTTPHFEQQFAACLPHQLPATPSTTPLVENPPGAGAQPQVSMTLANGNIFVARAAYQSGILFDVFDPQHNLLSENSITYLIPNPPSGGAPDSFETMVLADLNGDGKLDLVAEFDNDAFAGVGGVWTFLGNGDGTFQPGTRQVVLNDTDQGGMGISLIAVADLNGDGKTDLAFTRVNLDSVYVVLGNGDGTFGTNITTVPLGLSPSYASIGSLAIADLNGDGKDDLVAGVTPINNLPINEVAVLLGNGNASFSGPAIYPVLQSEGFDTAAVAIGDVNGDGIPDIVTSGGSILFGDATGAFPSRADYAVDNNGAVMIGDVDGDGIPDIVFGIGNPAFFSGSSGNPSANVLFGSGKGEFVGAPASGIGDADVESPLLIADFNGDGVPDALVTKSIGVPLQVTTLLGQGNGKFSTGFTQTLPAFTDTGANPAIAADFNHDGKLDVAVLAYYPTVNMLIFPGNGDGSFGAPEVSAVADSNVGFITSADFNGDGIPDLLLVGSDALYVWIGKGDGTFTPAFNTPAATPSTAIGDFNEDGKPDIAFVNNGSKTLNVLLGKGDGTFPTTLTTTLPSIAAGYGNDITAADFDGDGHLDLAVMLGNTPCRVGFPESSGEILVLSGKGDGTFPVAHSTSGFMEFPTAADINGDGIVDLVGSVPAGFAIQLGNGDGTFQPESVVFSEGSYFSVADLNKDGKPDIAILTGGVAAFLNLSEPPPALTVVSAASFAPGPLAPGAAGSIFGNHLASTTASGAPSTPIGGITVTIQDSAGVSRSAPLFYVSYGLINFLVPSQTATGPATLTITGGTKPLSTQIEIAAFAPAIFSMGADTAAAYVVQVAPNGAQTILPPGTISVSQSGETFLILFGSGFDSATAGDVSVTVQGIPATVTYSGLVAGYPGLDSINVLLPPSLAGTGLATVIVSVNREPANAVLVSIQ